MNVIFIQTIAYFKLLTIIIIISCDIYRSMQKMSRNIGKYTVILLTH